MLDVSPGRLGAVDDIVGTVLLVGGDEVGVVDAGQRLHLGHLLAYHLLERRLQNLSTVHGLGHVHAADIPTTHNEIIGMDHGEQVMEGHVDLVAGLGVGAQLDGGAHDDGAVVVRSLGTLASLPGQTPTVGNETGGDGGTVVTTPSDKHDPDLAHLAVDLEVVGGGLGSGSELAIGATGNIGGMVGILGLDIVVGVDDVGGVDSEEGGGRPVHGAVGHIRMRSHCES